MQVRARQARTLRVKVRVGTWEFGGGEGSYKGSWFHGSL